MDLRFESTAPSRLFAFLLYCLVLTSCGGATRDVIPESHDVRVVDPAAAEAARKNGADGYVYVARRSFGVVALAEARGIGDDVAARAIDRLADTLDACARDLNRQGKLVDGALRVVASIERDGSVSGLNLKLEQGNGIAANALLCVVAPLKLLTFPAAEGDAGARGIAVETTWGPKNTRP